MVAVDGVHAYGAAPLLRVREVEAAEREVRFRIPFRFGAATVHGAPQAFVRIRAEGPDGRSVTGGAAELLVPKWFDKDPRRSHAEDVDRLRESVALAAESLRADGAARSAFAAARACAAETRPVALARGLSPLAAGLGPALLERALVDAACRWLGVSFEEALRANALGFEIGPAAFPDLRGFDLAGFLAARRLAPTIDVRHTVGLADAIREADAEAGGPDAVVGDGLPESVEEALTRYGLRWLKVKVAGSGATELARLAEIAALLDDRAPHVRVTLDGNESFPDVDAALGLVEALRADPRLARFAARIAYLEQPLPRAIALDVDVRPLASAFPVMIDESDDTDDAFVRARARGYAGVSSKGCKGLHRALANAARCAAWNAEAGREREFFVSAEDLTTQAGLALQQDLALASAIGCTHAERNGHHYVGGMQAPAEEGACFVREHPDLYADGGAGPRLRIEDGRISLASLRCVGFASAVLPELGTMQPLAPRLAEPEGSAA